jgi:hypothetical protein
MRTRIFVRWNSRVPILRTENAMSLDSNAPPRRAGALVQALPEVQSLGRE